MATENKSSKQIIEFSKQIRLSLYYNKDIVY